MASLLDHIGRACKEAREATGLLLTDIAAEASSNHATLSRFETRGVLPQAAREIIAAYARETGRTERDLWLRAMELWQNEG